MGAYAPTAEMRLIVQKQPGAPPRTFESRMVFPTEWKIRTAVPELARSDENRALIKTSLDRDLYVGLVLEKR